MSLPASSLSMSWLFIPGNSEKMLSKFRDTGADTVILDLEDSVPPEEKSRARESVVRTVRDSAEGGGDAEAAGPAPRIFVRVNPVGSAWQEEDIFTVVCPGVSGIMVPKAESRDSLVTVAAGLSRAEQESGMEPESVEIAALVETPAGVLSCSELASSPRVTALALGGEDYCLALGMGRTRGGEEISFARGMLVTSAAACGVQPVDTVWTDIPDADGLADECHRVRALGFSGKLAVHPAQVPVIQKCFSPSKQELDEARRIVEAFEDSGRGVVDLEGQMIDAPVVERARGIIQRARFDEP